MIATDIKNQIKVNLDALVTAGKLGSVLMDDFRDDLLNRDIPTYPCAILTTPAIESMTETNRDNLRTHIFQILVMQKGENVASATDVEDLIENILNQFDNDPTLGGKASGGVEPSSSTPEAITTGDRTYIVFTVTLKAKALKSLTF